MNTVNFSGMSCAVPSGKTKRAKKVRRYSDVTVTKFIDGVAQSGVSVGAEKPRRADNGYEKPDF